MNWMHLIFTIRNRLTEKFCGGPALYGRIGPPPGLCWIGGCWKRPCGVLGGPATPTTGGNRCDISSNVPFARIFSPKLQNIYWIFAANKIAGLTLCFDISLLFYRPYCHCVAFVVVLVQNGGAAMQMSKSFTFLFCTMKHAARMWYKLKIKLSVCYS